MNVLRLAKLSLFLVELRDLQKECENERDSAAPGSHPDDFQLDKIKRALEDGVKLCEAMGFTNAGAQLSLIQSHHTYAPSPADYSSWTADLRNAYNAFMNELWARCVVQIEPGCADFIDNSAILGEPVKEAFPSAMPDIEEVGNCMAVGLGTAAVFHLMRIAEYGLRSLAIDRRIRVPKGKSLDLASWDEIIRELEDAEDAIRNYPKTKAREAQFAFYHGAMMEFKRFKNKFRNRIMHTRASYDKDEARSVFGHVKEFMTILARHISETKRTPVIWKGKKWITTE